MSVKVRESVKVQMYRGCVLLIVTLATLIASFAHAQTPAPSSLPTSYADSRDAVTDEVVAAEIRRRYPEIDLAGQHDTSKINCALKGEARYAYTRQMTRVFDIWIALGNGAALEKVLDAQREGKAREAIFQALLGYFYLSYPPNVPINIELARDALNKAVELDGSFEVARFFLAIHLLRYSRNARLASEHIDAALKERPEYVEAILLRAQILRESGGDTNEVLALCGKAFGMKSDLRGSSDQALDLYRRAATESQAQVYFEELLAKETNEQRRASVACQLGILSIDARDYARAVTYGEQTLKWSRDDTYPTLRLAAYVYVLVPALVASYRDAVAADAARETKDEAAVAAARAKTETCFQDAVKLDLAHLVASDTERGYLPVLYANFLIDDGRSDAALAMLLAYDREVDRLTPSRRESIRLVIENLAARSGEWPIQRWKKLSGPDGEKELERELKEKCWNPYLADKEGTRLDAPELIAFMRERIAANHRDLSRRAMRIAAVGATQTKEDGKTRIAEVRAAIKAKLAADGGMESKAEQWLLEDAFAALKDLGGKESALVVLDYLKGKESALKDKGFDRSANEVFRMACKKIVEIIEQETQVAVAVKPPSSFENWQAFADWATAIEAAIK